MADEDLEFHVIFPPALSPEERPKAEDSIYLDDNKEPVVILLGWTGCQNKHLAKYSAIYQQRRLTTIRYTLPIENEFLRQHKVKEIAVKLLELLVDLGLENNIIFFHVFSNAGVFLYHSITEVLNSPIELHDSSHTDQTFNRLVAGMQVGGVVFDSSPTTATSLTAGKLIASGAPYNTFIRYTFAFFYAIGMWFLVLLAFCIPVLARCIAPYSTFYTSLQNERGRYPQLFLYSKADSIVDFKDIERFAELRKKMGVPVRKVCWEDSAHCCHLVSHREEYINQCVQFINDCLKMN
ncbi:transmembrane protein 53-like [Saccoglossus kowalevskii]|uniref:Transmembrane protein 53-like n=1 Tax=Saccoglossus kowalevskii TaxID=10224 RepID=A0ABM0H0D9_SACKO|nr:PREDICTED: transmembrane protein 53-like [Saccoglossus kowalevskii]